MRIQLVIASAALLLIIPGLKARSAPAPSTIPFELYKGHIFVSAYVNGRGPYRFGFDTGASGDGRVDAQLTAALSLPKAGTRETSDGITTATADLVSVANLRFGPVEKRDLELLSRDYNRGRRDEHSIMGIIGRDFVADWLVRIDYPRRSISLTRGHLRADDPGVVSYGPSFSIPVCFAAACYPAKVDTGSSRGIVVPKDLVARLSTGARVRIGEANRMNSSAIVYEVPLEEPLRVAGIAVSGQKLLYTDPSDTVINIGSDFLKDYVLTIDQREKLLRIERP